MPLQAKLADCAMELGQIFWKDDTPLDEAAHNPTKLQTNNQLGCNENRKGD